MDILKKYPKVTSLKTDSNSFKLLYPPAESKDWPEHVNWPLLKEKVGKGYARRSMGYNS